MQLLSRLVFRDVNLKMNRNTCRPSLLDPVALVLQDHILLLVSRKVSELFLCHAALLACHRPAVPTAELSSPGLHQGHQRLPVAHLPCHCPAQSLSGLLSYCGVGSFPCRLAVEPEFQWQSQNRMDIHLL